MIHLTLEQAQTYLGDPEAIQRGYLTPQTLTDAERLARAVVALPTFGRIGHLGDVGYPHPWWEANCPAYAELAQADRYRRARFFSMLCRLVDAMVRDDLVEAVEARRDALRLIRSELDNAERSELNALEQWLQRREVAV